MPSLLIVQGVVVLIGFLLYQLFFRNKSELLPLPPGPRGLPIVGNIRDLPPPGVPDFQHWLPFKDRYGPISSVTMLGRTMVIIHDKDAAAEFLDKASAKTSSRPQFHFADMCGFDKIFSLMDYTDVYRRHRKIVHQQFGTKALVSRFDNIQDVESKRFLMRVLKNPQDLFQHIKTEAAAIILKINYDYTIDPFGLDPLVKLIEDYMEIVSQVMVPLGWLVDIFPAVKHLPDWFPGTGFKQTAREWKATTEASAFIPYSFVEKQMDKAIHQPSYVSELIEAYSDGKSTQVDQEIKEGIAWTAGTVFAAGSDTTVGTLMAFVLAMILHPEVQQKAQEEIDRVIGPNRLPGYEDQSSLPYIDALIKEMLRWFPITPMSTSHKSDDEMFLRGYRIPKGSYTLTAVWWFMHDPQTYPDPMAFDPDRFLEPRNEPDPVGMFGYGRRICPGRFFAQNNLFIIVSRTLAAFTISKAVDGNGKPVDVQLSHIPGMIDHPNEFPYNIAPRNEKCTELIQRLELDHPWEESDVESLEWGEFERYKKEWEGARG
ncbi:cytochrome P450 [Trichoderma ceciliae]